MTPDAPAWPVDGHVHFHSLDAVAPTAVVSACANCRIQLEEGLEVNNMDIPVISLTETIADHLAGETSAEARQS